VDEQGRRMKSVIAELAMENELLRERIRRLEDEKPSLGGRRDEPRPLELHRAALWAGSGAEGMGPATGDVLRAAPAAPVLAATCSPRAEDSLQR